MGNWNSFCSERMMERAERERETQRDRDTEREREAVHSFHKKDMGLLQPATSSWQIPFTEQRKVRSTSGLQRILA